MYKGRDMWDFFAMVFHATCSVADDTINMNAIIDMAQLVSNPVPTKTQPLM